MLQKTKLAVQRKDNSLEQESNQWRTNTDQHYRGFVSLERTERRDRGSIVGHRHGSLTLVDRVCVFIFSARRVTQKFKTVALTYHTNMYRNKILPSNKPEVKAQELSISILIAQHIRREEGTEQPQP